MAAEDNGAGFLGIAWGATFKVFTMPVGEHLDSTPDFDWEAAYRSVLAAGVDIVNASYGFPGTFVENYTVQQLRTVDRLGPPLQVVAQRGRSNPTIFVWLAGNSHGEECDANVDSNCVAASSSSTGYSYSATSSGPEAGAMAKLPELARAHSGRRGRGRKRCDRRLLQPLRHRRPVVYRRTGRRHNRRLLRPHRAHARDRSLQPESRRHLRRRAHGERRPRADEALLPQPALQQATGLAALRHRRQERPLRARPLGRQLLRLRPGADEPRRRGVAGGLRPGGEHLHGRVRRA